MQSKVKSADDTTTCRELLARTLSVIGDVEKTS